MDDFNPYRKWLGIPPHEQPPNYYRLLGLTPFETDAEAIANAADRQMAHLRTFQGGKNSAVSQKILNEVAAARICLMDPKKRAQYDAQLRAKMQPPDLPAPPTVELPTIAAPPIIVFPPGERGRAGAQSAAAAPYHPPRRKKNRSQGPVVTLIVSGIGLLIAAWFIYIAVDRQLFPPMMNQKTVKKPPRQPAVIPKKTAEQPAKENPPPPPSPTSKESPPNSAKKPADVAGENEKIGKRLCFMKGNWSEGLPKLAASGNNELKSLAEKELANPDAAAERLAVADGWWAVSEKYYPPAGEQIRRHAVEWYQKVVGDLEEGSDRDRAEGRIAQETPPPSGEKPPINPDMLE
ncbi:MAG: hypothetical protein IT426_12495 [Pirellulales bacterium]|nr:hypothetical protein [Pirellulales bacterium]